MRCRLVFCREHRLEGLDVPKIRAAQPGTDSESVRELVEEGQFFEAAVVSGVENAPPADAGPVKTRQRPIDDVPREYTDHAPDEPKE